MGKALEFALLFAALLLLAMVSVSATFRAKLRVIVAKNFFAYRYDYREEWLRFTQTLAAGLLRRHGCPASELLPIWWKVQEGVVVAEQTAGFQVERSSLPRTDAIEPADSSLPRSCAARAGSSRSDVRRQPAKYRNWCFHRQ